MNQLDFTEKAGWPASAETWEFLQNMILQTQFASLLGGRNWIVDGCVESGGNVTDGTVCIDGELLPFVGGPIQSSVIIVNDVTNRAFFGGASKPYYHRRSATFGSGSAAIAWTSFQRNDPDNGVLAIIGNLQKRWLPGDIKMAHLEITYIRDNFDATGLGKNERSGWAVCNGQNGTADMTDKLPIGYDWSLLASSIRTPKSARGSKKIEKTNLPAVGVGYRDRYYVELNSALTSRGATQKVSMPLNYNSKVGSDGTDKDNDTWLYYDATTDPLGNGTDYIPDSVITLYLMKL